MSATPATPRLFALAAPLIITMILMMLDAVNIRYWMGTYLHAEGLAVHTTTAPVVVLGQIAYYGIATGCGVLVARSVGARDGRGLSLFGAGVVLVVVTFAILETVVLVIAGPLSERLATSTVGAEAIRTYLVWWTLLAAPALALASVAVQAAAGAGLTRFALSQAVVHLALAVALLPLFMGPLDQGYRAPGLAIACAGLANTAQLWIRLRAQASAHHLGEAFDRAMMIAPKVWRDILDIGLPAQLSRALTGVVAITVVLRVGEAGMPALAGYGIAMIFVETFGAAGVGFSHAVQILMSQRLGARDPAGARLVLWRALGRSQVIPAIALVVLVVLAPSITRLFTSSPEVHAESVRAMRVLGITLFPAALWQTMLSAFASARATRPALIVTVIATSVALVVALAWPWDRLAGAVVTLTTMYALLFTLYVLLSVRVLWRGALAVPPGAS